MDVTPRPTGADTFATRSGRVFTVREATRDDLDALRTFFAGLSDHSRRLRFFATTRKIDEKILRGMVRAPGCSGTCVLACDPLTGVIAGAAQYAPDGPGTAEVAVAVSDALHGEGIGTELLHRAAAHATKEGFVRFSAMVLAENNEMLHVFRDCGLPSSCHMNGPIDRVIIDLIPNPEGVSIAAPPGPLAPLLRAS